MRQPLNWEIINENKTLYLLKNGQETEAIELFYQNVWPIVLKYIVTHNGDEQQAEDLFHDVILKFVMKVRNGELNDLKETEPYLYVMVKNLWVSKMRKDSKIQLTEDLLKFKEAKAANHDFESEKKYEILNDALESLGGICRDLLQLTFYMDNSLKMASEKLGLSGADVARTYQYRCKKKLFETLKNNLELKELLAV